MRRWVIYPFLLGLYISLDPLSRNLSQLSPGQFWRPFFAIQLGVGIAYLVARQFFIFANNILRHQKSSAADHYAGIMAFLALVYIFFFGHLRRLLGLENQNALSFLLLWTGIFGAFFLVITWFAIFKQKRSTLESSSAFLNIVLLVTLLAPAGRLAIELKNNTASPQSQPNLGADPDLQFTSLKPDQLPDIYLIFVDGYGRADVLQEIYSYDNTEFLHALQQRGFFIAGQSHSNYLQTPLSVSATLNFDYFYNWSPPPGDIGYNNYLKQPVYHSRAFTLLKQAGYQTIAIDSGFAFTRILEADRFVTRAAPVTLNDLERLLLSYSLLGVLRQQQMEAASSTQEYESHRQQVWFVFEQIQAAASLPSPKFVFAHVLSPHPPFVFNQKGEPAASERPYALFDGSSYGGSLQEYWQGYRDQTIYINSLLLQTIDAILSNADPDHPPIILIQADHGPGSMFNWNSAEQSCLWERTAILNAYYLPAQTSSSHQKSLLLYDTISPVNSFRVIFNTYFGTHFDQLEDRTFYSTWSDHTTLTEITTMRDSHRNCFLTENIP